MEFQISFKYYGSPNKPLFATTIGKRHVPLFKNVFQILVFYTPKLETTQPTWHYYSPSKFFSFLRISYQFTMFWHCRVMLLHLSTKNVILFFWYFFLLCTSLWLDVVSSILGVLYSVTMPYAQYREFWRQIGSPCLSI